MCCFSLSLNLDGTNLAHELYRKPPRMELEERREIKMIKRILLGAGLVTACVAAQASTFQFVSKDLGDYIQVYGVRDGLVFAGSLNFKDSAAGNLKTYCVDLIHGFGPGNTFNATTLDSATQSARLKEAGNIIAAGAGSVKTNDQAAGLQLAVWNVLYNGGDKLDLSHGAFRATASASALGYAEQFFALRNKAGHSVYFKNTGHCGNGGEMATPEPASIGALIIGVGALLRRKKKA